jgi:hypothetical protein
VPGNSSTVTISSTTTGFTGSTLSANAVNGVATFSAIKPTTVGTANILTASDGSLTGATSGAFTVTAASPGTGIAERGAATTANGAGVSSLTINTPAGVVAGDVMIVNLTLHNAAGGVFYPSLPGWTSIAEGNFENVAANHRSELLYRVASSSEPSSYTFALGGAADGAAGAIVAFSGVNTTSGPFDVTPGSFTTGSGTSISGVPAITTADANAAVLMFGGTFENDTLGSFSTTSPGSLTSLYSSNPNGGIGAGWGTKASAGSTGAGTGTDSVNQVWGAILLALKPVPVVGPAANLAFTTLPASTTAGSTTASVVVQIQDANGNNVPQSGTSITLTLSSGSFTGGSTTTVSTDSSGKATFSNLAINAAGTYTMTAAGGSLASATSDSFNIAAGTASQLVVTLPGQAFTSGSGNSGTVSGQTAGTSFNIMLTAVDANNNIAAFSGSKTVSYSGPANAPGGATPTYTTSVTFVSGQAASLATTLVDAQTATMTPGISGSGLTGVASSSLTVSAASMNKFALSLASPQVSGAAFTGTDTLAAEDAYGNTVTSFNASANNVTIAANSPLTGAVSGLSGGNKLASGSDFVSGVANLASAGMKYTGNANSGTFTATAATGGYTGTSGSVTINAGTATKLVITGSGTQKAGQSQNLTITAEDASGNTATTYTGSKSLTFSGAGSSPSGTAPTVVNSSGTAIAFGSTTAMNFSSGVATVSSGKNGLMTLYEAQTATISVTDGSISSSGAGNLSVAVSAGSGGKLMFTTEPVDTEAGSNMASVVAQIEDGSGNPVAQSGTGITLTLNSGSFASGTPAVNSDSTGKATFANLVINIATNYTMKAAATGLATATSASFYITENCYAGDVVASPSWFVDTNNHVIITLTNSYGLLNVIATNLVNSTMTAEAYNALGQGTSMGALNTNTATALPLGTVEVVCTAALNAGQTAGACNARAMDLCNEFGATADPLTTLLKIGSTGVAQQILTNVMSADCYVSVMNGTPGLSQLTVVVNGNDYVLGPLSDEGTTTLDVGASMIAGYTNTVVLIGEGAEGASATITLGVSPTGDSMITLQYYAIQIQNTASGVQLSWPASAAGYVLQSRSSLAPSDAWVNWSGAATLVDGSFVVTVPGDAAQQFFRLCEP